MTRQQWQGITEEQKQIRAEAASHKCGICNEVATNWTQLYGWKAYLCDQHEAWGSYFRDGCLFCVPKEQARDTAEVESQPESHQCAMCDEPAKEWVDVHIKGYMCEQHKFVKLGCFSQDWTNDYVVDGTRKYTFCNRQGYWVGYPLKDEP